jgi:hypothetical protein
MVAGGNDPYQEFASLATLVAAGIAATDTNWGAWARPATLIIALFGAM